MLVMTVHLIDLRSDVLRCFNYYVLLISFILLVYFLSYYVQFSNCSFCGIRETKKANYHLVL